MGLEGQVIPQQSFYSIIYLTVLLVEVAVKISNFGASFQNKFGIGFPYNKHGWTQTTIQCKKYKDHERKRKFFDWKKTASKLDEKPEALKSLYRSPGYKKNELVLCKNYVLQC